MASELFVRASALVTGERTLLPDLASAYEAIFNAEPGAAVFLKACDAAFSTDDPMSSLKQAIAADPDVGIVASALVHLWFVGALPPKGGKDQSPVNPEAYFGALIWPVIGAHPPGLSGGYFGHWRYMPDD